MTVQARRASRVWPANYRDVEPASQMVDSDETDRVVSNSDAEARRSAPDVPNCGIALVFAVNSPVPTPPAGAAGCNLRA